MITDAALEVEVKALRAALEARDRLLREAVRDREDTYQGAYGPHATKRLAEDVWYQDAKALLAGKPADDPRDRLIAEQSAILDDLEGAFDEQTYAEMSRDELDAPDDREYSVNITAKQLRAISTAVARAAAMQKEKPNG